MENSFRAMSPGDHVFVVTRAGSLADPATLDYVVSSATVQRVEKNGLMVKPSYGFESFVPDERLFFDTDTAQHAAKQLMLADHVKLREQSTAVDRKLFEIEGQINEMMPLLDLNEKTYTTARLAGVKEFTYSVPDYRRDPMVIGGVSATFESVAAFEDVRLARPGEKLEAGDVTPVIVGMRDGSFLAGSMTCVEAGPNPVAISFEERFDDIELAREGAQICVNVEMERRGMNTAAFIAERTGQDEVTLDDAVRDRLEKNDRKIISIEPFDLSVGQTKQFTGRVHAITETTVYQEVRNGAVIALPVDRIQTPVGTDLAVGQTITSVHSYMEKAVNVTVHEQEQAVEISR